MKNVYIILSHTGTLLSRIIKLATGNEYTHSSLSLDESLEKMYSFGRLNPYNAFIGGYVEEGIKIGTFKRFKNTMTGVYRLQVTDEQYSEIIETLNYVRIHKQKYKFNTLGLAFARTK